LLQRRHRSLLLLLLVLLQRPDTTPARGPHPLYGSARQTSTTEATHHQQRRSTQPDPLHFLSATTNGQIPLTGCGTPATQLNWACCCGRRLSTTSPLQRDGHDPSRSCCRRWGGPWWA